MEKHILEQYVDAQQEEKDIVKRIRKLNDEILKMEVSEYRAADSVTCGRKGKKPLGTKKIEGFPYPEYYRKKNALKNYKAKLEVMDQNLLELMTKVEEYIDGIENSRIRRIIRYRYIDGISWTQVAHRMGKNHTAESCRKAHDRFLEGKEHEHLEGK